MANANTRLQCMSRRNPSQTLALVSYCDELECGGVEVGFSRFAITVGAVNLVASTIDLQVANFPALAFELFHQGRLRLPLRARHVAKVLTPGCRRRPGPRHDRNRQKKRNDY